MSEPILLISDTHLHDWTAFSRTLPTGVNSRLQEILNAQQEAVRKLKAADGERVYNAGDTFHVRGKVTPSVLNPATDLYAQMVNGGIGVYVIPGNHDLEGRDSHRVSNAVTALESVGVIVAHEPKHTAPTDNWHVVMFPWYADVNDLLVAMAKERKLYAPEDLVDAIIHAPIDKVLPHLPDHGLSADSLADLGYNRVFSGHYHHHKDMGRGVYSIGALTHQTFGDIGSKAGYLLVYPDRVEHFESSAPKFVEVTGEETPAELAEKVKGNYVRCRLEVSSDKELEEIRSELLGQGAAGVVITPVKKVVVSRAGSTAASGASIESSIGEFVTKKGFSPKVQALCVDILSEARASE